jgi:hypothetical protein
MMMDTVTIHMPADWLQGMSLNQEDLREVVSLGLEQLHRKQGAANGNAQIVEALMATARVRHWTVASLEVEATGAGRQPPPAVPGPSLSETIIAQRRGE